MQLLIPTYGHPMPLFMVCTYSLAFLFDLCNEIELKILYKNSVTILRAEGGDLIEATPVQNIKWV